MTDILIATPYFASFEDDVPGALGHVLTDFVVKELWAYEDIIVKELTAAMWRTVQDDEPFVLERWARHVVTVLSRFCGRTIPFHHAVQGGDGLICMRLTKAAWRRIARTELPPIQRDRAGMEAVMKDSVFFWGRVLGMDEDEWPEHVFELFDVLNEESRMYEEELPPVFEGLDLGAVLTTMTVMGRQT